MTSVYNDYQYLIAYGIMIVAFMLLIRTRFGYVTAYYTLALFAFTLTLINSNALVKLLAPISDQTTTAATGATNV